MLDLIYRWHWKIMKRRKFSGIHRRIENLEKDEHLTCEEWQSRIWNRLRNILVFANANVPFYKEIFKSVGFDPQKAVLPKDYFRIPLLTKSIISTIEKKLLSEANQNAKVYENMTGGSTGNPLRFYQDHNYKELSEALYAYVCLWWGIKPYDRTAFIWGADREFQDLSIKERFYNWRYRTRSLNAFRMAEDDLHRFYTMLIKWRPPYLMGYSTALETFAKFIADNKYTGLQFKAIRSSAEMLYPHQRKIIAQNLNGPVYNFYGSREINNIAAECPEENNLHLISTYRYVEISDDDGYPVTAGTPGNLVITDLSNLTMPFIRYRNNDIGIMAKEKCPCGRPSPVLESILGRSSDMIRSPNGDLIHGEFFTHLFYGIPHIKQFQIHQTHLEQLKLLLVTENNFLPQNLDHITYKIRERMGKKIQIKIENVDKIPVPLSGKHRFTISDLT